MRSILRFIALATFTLSTFSVEASHLIGGNLAWYSTSQPNAYRFELTLYRDCRGGISLPTTSQNITGPFGNIVLFYNAGRSGAVSTNRCFTSQCNNLAGVEKYVYISNPITLNQGIPPTGWEFSYSACCYPTSKNTSASGMYFSTIMYPNAQGGLPDVSTVNDALSLLMLDGYGSKSFNLQPQYLGNADSVQTVLSSPLTGANTSVVFNSGYNALHPLPDSSESPLNGPFLYNPKTGVGSVSINDSNNLGGFYLMSVDHLYFKDGVLVAKINKPIPVLMGNTFQATPAPTVSVTDGNQAIPYQYGMAPPVFTLTTGDSLNLNFMAIDVGDSLRMRISSVLLDTARPGARGWGFYNNLQVNYLNANNSPLVNNLGITQVQLKAGKGNEAEGSALITFEVEDFNCPNNPICYPVMVQFKPSVAIQKFNRQDTIPLCSGNDSLFAKAFNNGAYWSPGNLVADSSASRTVFTGTTSTWLYLNDTVDPSHKDSVYIQVVPGSVSIGGNNGNLVLYDSVGLTQYQWRLNGIPYQVNTPTLFNPVYGVYDLTGTNGVCYYETDTVVVNAGNGFAIAPPSGANSVLPERQQLDSTYGFQFAVMNGNLVTEQFSLNSVQVYGISSTANKNSFSTITLKVFDATQTEIYGTQLVLDPNSPSVDFNPSLTLDEGQDYYVTVSGDTNAYYSFYQSQSTPYTVGSFMQPGGQLEVKAVLKGPSTTGAPSQASDKHPALTLSLSSTIGLAERTTAQFSLYPNPASDQLNLRYESSDELQFEIYALSGQLLIETTLSPERKYIDISQLSPGTYFIKSKLGQQKFVKQ